MCTQKGMMLFLDGSLLVVVIQYYINTINLMQINERIKIFAENLPKNCVNNQLGRWINYVSTKEFVFNHAIHKQMPFEIFIWKILSWHKLLVWCLNFKSNASGSSC